MMTHSRLLSLFFLVAVSACAVKTDLGKECILVRKDPNDPSGKKSIAITEAEIKPNKDFISFGAVECEDLVCVRDASLVRNVAPTDPAVGYCSRSCVQASPLGCVAADEKDKLACRALVLDESSLAAIKQADPATYRRYFGDTTSPYFCARGGKTDGGS